MRRRNPPGGNGGDCVTLFAMTNAIALSQYLADVEKAEYNTHSEDESTLTGYDMASFFPCPYLNSQVEMTDEREQHIAERHPELLPKYRQCIAGTLAQPDAVRRSARLASARLFTRWFDTVRDGKYVVVVVVSDAAPQRHWIITAYIARKLAEGEIEWKRE